MKYSTCIGKGIIYIHIYLKRFLRKKNAVSNEHINYLFHYYHVSRLFDLQAFDLIALLTIFMLIMQNV